MKKIKLILFLIASITILSLSNLGYAACYFDNGALNRITASLPSTIVKPKDTMPGTILWESGWSSNGGGSVTVSCNTQGEWTMGDLKPNITTFGMAKGFSDVYNTTVPGVGIRVFYCKDASCGEPPSGAYMGKAINGTTASKTDFEINIGKGPFPDIRSKYFVQLLATDEKIGTGQLSFSGIAASSYYGALVTSDLYISGSVMVKGSSCEVDTNSKYISVTLPRVMKGEFRMESNVLQDVGKSKSFNINLTCDKGLLVSYRIDAITDKPNVISNGKGEDMAKGIGLQLFKGGSTSLDVQNIGSWENISNDKTIFNAQSITIPLTVKYYRTVPTVNEIIGGRVSSLATFNISYL